MRNNVVGAEVASREDQVACRVGLGDAVGHALSGQAIAQRGAALA